MKGQSLEEVQASFNYDKQDEAETRGDDAEPNRDVTAQPRTRGTVQSSRWTFKQRNLEEKWFAVIRRDREWNHPDVLDREPYALAVTVADRDTEHAKLYTETQAKLTLKSQVREEARQRAGLWRRI